MAENRFSELSGNKWVALVDEQMIASAGFRKPNTRDTPDEWGGKFLEAYAQTGNVTTSAAVAGVTPVTVYLFKQRDAEFAACMELMRECFVDLLHEEMVRRGLTGYDTKERKTVSARVQGQLVTLREEEKTVRKHSDRILVFLAETLAPDRFKRTLTVNMPSVDEMIEEIAQEEGVPANVIRLEAERIAKKLRERKAEQGLRSAR